MPLRVPVQAAVAPRYSGATRPRSLVAPPPIQWPCRMQGSPPGRLELRARTGSAARPRRAQAGPPTAQTPPAQEASLSRAGGEPPRSRTQIASAPPRPEPGRPSRPDTRGCRSRPLPSPEPGPDTTRKGCPAPLWASSGQATTRPWRRGSAQPTGAEGGASPGRRESQAPRPLAGRPRQRQPARSHHRADLAQLATCHRCRTAGSPGRASAHRRSAPPSNLGPTCWTAPPADTRRRPSHRAGIPRRPSPAPRQEGGCRFVRRAVFGWGSTRAHPSGDVSRCATGEADAGHERMINVVGVAPHRASRSQGEKERGS